MKIKCEPRKHMVVILRCTVMCKYIYSERAIGVTRVGENVNMKS